MIKSKYIRLVIYSFLDSWDLLHLIAPLSSFERLLLPTSSFITRDRGFKLVIPNMKRKNAVSLLDFSYVLGFASHLHVTFRARSCISLLKVVLEGIKGREQALDRVDFVFEGDQSRLTESNLFNTLEKIKIERLTLRKTKLDSFELFKAFLMSNARYLKLEKVTLRFFLQASRDLEDLALVAPAKQLVLSKLKRNKCDFLYFLGGFLPELETLSLFNLEQKLCCDLLAVVRSS